MKETKMTLERRKRIKLNMAAILIARQQGKKARWGAKSNATAQPLAQQKREKAKPPQPNTKQSQTGNRPLDFELYGECVYLGCYHLEAGTRKFSDWAVMMADDLGTTITRLRPYLRSWYCGARCAMEDQGLSVEGMESDDQVRTALNSLLKEEEHDELATTAEERDSADDGERHVTGDLFDKERGPDGREAARAGRDTHKDRRLQCEHGVVDRSTASTRTDSGTGIHEEAPGMANDTGGSADSHGSSGSRCGRVQIRRPTDEEINRLVGRRDSLVYGSRE